ncbi:T9SS type A sorting domain-containing protein [bacterium]|nr:T9SS type A sorting domain-containing protein [bacterium]
MKKIALFLIVLLALASMGIAQTAIHDIQFVDNPGAADASPMVGQEVTVHGWITFEPMSFGGNRFFMADDAGAWNGIYVYTGDNDFNLGFGWEVEVTGVVEEYISGGGDFGITELNAADGTVTVVSEDVDWLDLPAACAYTEVTAVDLAGGQASAEQFESVLVTVSEISCINDDAGFGEWEVGDVLGSDFIVDNPSHDVWGYRHDHEVGMQYDYIRGILNWSFGDFKILPEIAFDLKVHEDPANGSYTPFAWFQQVRPMDMTIREDDEGNPYTRDESYSSLSRYQHYDEDFEDTTFVTVHGLVTMPTGLSYAGAGVKYMMADFDTYDPEGEYKPWNSVLSYDQDSTAFPTLYEGDEVIATGYIDEYNTGPAHMTEFWLTATVDFLTAGNPLPTPAVVTTAELRDPLTAEQWGNVFIDVQNSMVTNNELQYELFTIDDNLEDDIRGVSVDDDSDSLTNYEVPPMNTNMESVKGWLYHHYGTFGEDVDDWVYKVCPLYVGDIVVGTGPPSILSASRTPGVPGSNDDVTVSAEIIDDTGVEFATVYWKMEADAEWNMIDMVNTEELTWEGTIPGQADGSDIWYYIEATDEDEASSTYPGQAGRDGFGYWAVDEPGIFEMQYTPFPSGRSPYDGNLVTISGVVTTTPEISTHYGAYFIQTGTDAAYSGICATIPTEIATPQEGDMVTLTGTVDESGAEWNYKWGLNTKMIDVVDCTIESNGNAYEVYPVTIGEVNLAQEAHESVVIEISNLTVVATNQYDWTVRDASGRDMILDDDFVSEDNEDFHNYFGDILNGSTISMVKGVYTYSFGTWKIEPRGMDDLGELGVDDGFQATVPTEFALEQNFPNPFNPTTQVSFSVPQNTRVQLLVYNSLGRLVTSLIDAPLSAGQHSAYWDGRDYNNMPVTSGTYYLRLVANGQQRVRPMTLVK